MKPFLLSLLLLTACADIKGKDGTIVDENLVPKAWAHTTGNCDVLGSVGLIGAFKGTGECHYSFKEKIPDYNNGYYVVICTIDEVNRNGSDPSICTISDKNPESFNVNIYNLNGVEVESTHDVVVWFVE